MYIKNTYPQIPEEKVYKDITIYWATVLGGPLVAGYMLASNFKTLAEKDKVPFVWILMIGLSLLIFGFLRLVPHAFIFNFIFPFLYAFLPYYIAGNYQKNKINLLIATGGRFHELGRIMSIVLIGGAVTMLIFTILL